LPRCSDEAALLDRADELTLLIDLVGLFALSFTLHAHALNDDASQPAARSIIVLTPAHERADTIRGKNPRGGVAIILAIAFGAAHSRPTASTPARFGVEGQ
jgi:hypothetical protein